MEKSIDELRQEASSLGIDVDGRWSPETLKAKIAEAQQETETMADNEPAASEGMDKVKLLKNYRPMSHDDSEGGFHDRVMAGEVIDLPKEEASRAVKLRIATRDLEYEPPVIASHAELEGDG